MKVRVLVLSLCMLTTVSPAYGEDKATYYSR